MVYRFYDWRHKCDGASYGLSIGYPKETNARTASIVPEKIDIANDELSVTYSVYL